MPIGKATGISCANIAFIKYWGNRDDALRLPLTGSLSMNLAGLRTRTTVAFDPALGDDEVVIGGKAQAGEARGPRGERPPARQAGDGDSRRGDAPENPRAVRGDG